MFNKMDGIKKFFMQNFDNNDNDDGEFDSDDFEDRGCIKVRATFSFPEIFQDIPPENKEIVAFHLEKLGKLSLCHENRGELWRIFESLKPYFSEDNLYILMEMIGFHMDGF